MIRNNLDKSLRPGRSACHSRAKLLRIAAWPVTLPFRIGRVAWVDLTARHAQRCGSLAVPERTCEEDGVPRMRVRVRGEIHPGLGAATIRSAWFPMASICRERTANRLPRGRGRKVAVIPGRIHPDKELR